MLTEKEISEVVSSNKFDVDEILYGHIKLEDMEGYFRRERKENLLEQGYEIPEELKDPDDDNASTPEYLWDRPDPDIRSRYDGIYDGNQEEEPHYGSALYWQWLAVKYGRLDYLRAYDLSGNEMKLSGKMYWKILIQVYDHLLGTVKSPIRHNGYELYQIKRKDIDLKEDELPEGLAFVTVYLF
ncbi:MAG: hypothetical protein PHC54_07585 [Candidatus Omnitrophica bacterium]|nr:hypothetical protein [Candidatus Omnitrophota bacterium]